MVETYWERKYFNPQMETMPREKLRELQTKKLHSQLMYVYDNSPFYGARLKKAGVEPAKIKTLDDFEKYVPITSKDELRAEMERTGNAMPHLCVPIEKVTSILTSAGTTGIPTYAPMTRRDEDIRGEAAARNFWMCGVRPGMVMHETIFKATGCYARAALTDFLRCVWLPIELGPHNISQWMVQAKAVKPDVLLWGIPFYTAVEGILAKEGLKPKDVFSYKIYIAPGDVMTERMREHVEEMWGGKHYSLGGGAGDISIHNTECGAHAGLHFPQEDIMLIEVVDLKTRKAVKSGGRGELLFTDLEKEAAPLVRFPTEDLVDVNYETCECGRTCMRIKYLGRTTFKVVVKGKDVFPIEIEETIREIPETASYEFTTLKYAEDMDRLRVRLGCPPEAQSRELKGKVEEKVGSALGIPVEVEFCKPEELPRVPHKFIRMVDLTKEKA
jgi:phenylacetate-CoA ligase